MLKFHEIISVSNQKTTRNLLLPGNCKRLKFCITKSESLYGIALHCIETKGSVGVVKTGLGLGYLERRPGKLVQQCFYYVYLVKCLQ